MIRPQPASAWSTGAAGVFDGVSNADYHSAPGVSSSYLKRLAESPAHAKLPVSFSPVAQRAIDLGTLCHGLVLEGKCADELGFAMKPPGYDGRTAEGKAWAKENAGKPCIDADQLDTSRAVETAVFSDREARVLLSGSPTYGRTDGAFPELSLRAGYEGLTLKARFDLFRDGVIYDLKTSSKGANPDAFGRECEERGYLLQAAHYLHVAKLAGINAGAFVFVAAETVAPYEVACYEFGPEHPAWAPVNEALFSLYDLHATCERAQKWPKRSWGLSPVVVPGWSKFAAKGGRA